MTITEFLEARITEDEQREARKSRLMVERIDVYEMGPEYVDVRDKHGARERRLTLREFEEKYCEPAPDQRALAECAAKRAIAGLHKVGADKCDEHNAMFESIPCPTIRALAAVYADHPDYQQEWAT